MRKYAQAAATVPEPCRIFGTRLRPFSLGHHLLFRRLGLPFSGNALVDAASDEILHGIFICSMDYPSALDLFHSGEWTDALQRWLKKISRRKFFDFSPPFKRRITREFFLDAEALFRAYLTDGYQDVPTWRPAGKDSISLTQPWELVLKNKLVMNGFSELEVLNGYLPGRWYDYFSVGELLSAEKCHDPKNWRKIFFTKQDAEQFDAMDALERGGS